MGRSTSLNRFQNSPPDGVSFCENKRLCPVYGQRWREGLPNGVFKSQSPAPMNGFLKKIIIYNIFYKKIKITFFSIPTNVKCWSLLVNEIWSSLFYIMDLVLKWKKNFPVSHIRLGGNGLRENFGALSIQYWKLSHVFF